ncbi:MAG: hypothetical protein D6735_13055, partial [Acidobacteria bacterium]
MREVLIIALIVLFGNSFALYAQSNTATKSLKASDPKQEIKAVFDRLVEGIRQLDAEKVMSV